MVPVIGLLLAAILASASPDSSNIVEVDIGHGYGGSESFAMSGDRVMHTEVAPLLPAIRRDTSLLPDRR